MAALALEMSKRAHSSAPEPSKPVVSLVYARMAALALEMIKRAHSSAPEPSKPVVSPVCALCDSQDHLV